MISGSDQRRTLAAAGTLLVLPFALFAWVPGIGPPETTDAAGNQIRYVLLLIDSVAVAGGLILLRHSLISTGDKFYSLLGFAAVVLAGPIYTVFAAIQLAEYRAMLHAGVEKTPAEWLVAEQVSVILLFTGVFLAHLAAAAFAAALGRAQWVGSKTRLILVGLSLLAALSVAVNVADVFAFPKGPMWGFQHAYAVPGFVFSIPAIPWMIPCVLGIVLLDRARATP